MTYRPSQKSRWGWMVLVALAAAVAWVVLWLETQSWHQSDSSLEGVVATFVVLGTLIFLSILTWSSRVIVDDRGLGWKGGGGPADFMTWDQIAKLDYDRKSRTVFVGVIEKADGKFYRLPFMSRELYAALKERLNPLPEDVEKELFLTWGK
jgi:hypothetical protein